MPDLTTLALLAGLFLTVFAGQAAMYSDSLRVQINVPPSLTDRGFTEAVAEQVFSSEAAHIIRGDSIVPAPSLRINSQPSILSAILQPLSLGGVVPALQAQFGVNHLSVVAGIMQTAPDAATPEARKLDMVLVVGEPDHPPEQTRLTQDDGDPVALVRRAAQWTMERVAPYRVALGHFLSGTRGDAGAFARAADTAARALADDTQMLSGPGDASQAAERAMLYNIHGLVAAAQNDLPGAMSAYRAIAQIPQVPRAVQAETALNEAVIALALRQPGPADALQRRAWAHRTTVDLPGFDLDLDLVQGLIAWGQGELEGAERIFAAIAAAAPLSEAAQHYLGRVRAARGDAEGAAQALAAAQALHHAEPPQQELAVQAVLGRSGRRRTDPAVLSAPAIRGGISNG